MRVAIYCRLSDEDRNKANPNDDSESIQNQKNMLLNHALKQGWEIYDIYSDDDYTGSDRNRPEFNRMLRDAEAGKFKTVLCKTQSRFSRELEIVEKYIHGLFVDWGIRFIGLVDYADTEVIGNKKARQINGLVNEWYLEDLSGNVCASLDNKRKNGKYIASFALFGYKKSEQDKNLIVIDDPAARIVRRIFQEYDDGHGLFSIARMLSDEGIPNPTYYKRSVGLKVMSKSRNALSAHWSVNTVRNILGNRMYLGDMIQGKQEKVSYKSNRLRRVPKSQWFVVENTHEPIIDESLWERVQYRLSAHSKMRKNGTVHIFAGKAFCSDCGLALHANTSKGHKYLRCPKGDVSRMQCAGCRINLEQLEKRVLQEINSLSRQFFDEQLVAERVTVRDTSEAELQVCQDELNAVSAKANEHDKARLALYLDKVRGIVSEADFNTLNTLLLRESDSISMQKAGLERRMQLLEENRKNKRSKSDIIGRYRHFEALNRAMVGDFIDRIEVGRRDPETKAIRVNIIWQI